jgi:hypothetical protein
MKEREPETEVVTMERLRLLSIIKHAAGGSRGLGQRVAITMIAVGLCIAISADSTLVAQSAQTAAVDTVYRVRLLDGSTLYGRLENRSDTAFSLVTMDGVRAEISRAHVREMNPASGRVVMGEYWAPDPNPSRLFFSPTARSVGRGSGYAGVFMIGLPFVAVGLTDRITLAGGAPVLLGRLDPFYIAPKIELISTPTLRVAAGVLSVISLQEEFENGFGILYGVATLGSDDHALTAGIGYGYSGDDIAGEPAIMVGGETRASRRLKLITENYFIAGATGGILTGGIRYLGDRFTSDIGMMGFIGGGESFCCVPLVNFSYSFGRRQ